MLCLAGIFHTSLVPSPQQRHVLSLGLSLRATCALCLGLPCELSSGDIEALTPMEGLATEVEEAQTSRASDPSSSCLMVSSRGLLLFPWVPQQEGCPPNVSLYHKDSVRT